jgi:macrolide transport system ATP-binding/permease protein
MFRRRRSAEDFAEEINAHLGLEADALKDEGLTDEEARRKARVAFGSVRGSREQFYMRSRLVGLDNLGRDLRYALRQLRRNPGFAAAAILVLTLGIGASVAIFAFVDAALIQPLPYTNSNRLMAVDESEAFFPRSNMSFADYLDWKRMNKSFSSLDVYTRMGWLLKTPSGSEPIPAVRVSDGFFSTLGIKPMLGRVFLPGEDRPDAPDIAILSYGTWISRFGGQREIVGQSIT